MTGLEERKLKVQLDLNVEAKLKSTAGLDYIGKVKIPANTPLRIPVTPK